MVGVTKREVGDDLWLLNKTLDDAGKAISGFVVDRLMG